MSETAHDLRSPLTTVRESIRLVHDGDIGTITADQQVCLASAIDQCDCIDQMIGEMVQLERLRTGTPRVNRRWVAVSQIRQAIDETLRPWAMPRQIEVLWDGADDPTATVFADPSMLRRLVVNLVTNSIRVTAEGGSVLIRLQAVRDGDSDPVVGGGPGARNQRKRSATHCRSTSDIRRGRRSWPVDLPTIGRVALFHFADSITPGQRHRSQLRDRGRGTAERCRVMVQLASGAARRQLQKPHENQEAASPSSTRTLRRMRLDPPSVKIEVSHEASTPRCEDRLAAGIVSVGAAVSREAADAFDQLLQSQLQMFDLVYRVEHTSLGLGIRRGRSRGPGSNRFDRRRGGSKNSRRQNELVGAADDSCRLGDKRTLG